MVNSDQESPAEEIQPPVPLRDTEAAFLEVLPVLAPHDRIAVDTEADSLHCYFEKLCLIQISVPGMDMLIDPLAGFSLTPLWDALSGKEIVFHGADYDLRLLRRTGCPRLPRIFDTMLGARLCGYKEFSYAALLKLFFGLEIGKASQKSNWARRPLSPQMVAYAVNDTHHLLKVAELVEADLVKLGRREWLDQMCERAIRSAELDKEIDPDQVWRIAGSGTLRGRAAAILRELWHWREEEAKKVDRPTFHIMNSEMMIHAAERFDRGERVEIPHLRGSREHHFYEAAKRGQSLPQSEWPKFVRTERLRPTQEQLSEIEVFKKHRDKVATELQIDPSLIAPKAMLEGLAFRREETLARLLPWQRELMGV